MHAPYESNISQHHGQEVKDLFSKLGEQFGFDEQGSDTDEKPRRGSMMGSGSNVFSADDVEAWSPLRKRVARVVHTQAFEKCMGVLILANFVLIILEADMRAQCYPDYYDWPYDCPTYSVLSLQVANWGMLAAYTLEVAARVFVQRQHYFRFGWNILDLSVLIVDYVSEMLGGLVHVSFLKVFRTLRLVRALRLYVAFRELYLIINGLLGAMKAIAWGCLLLVLFITAWSIILVEFIHPTNSVIEYQDWCYNCNDSYKSVYNSDLTLFKTIVAGDDWGVHTTQIIEAEPFTCIAFVGVIISVSLGLMNLILAVIVQRAAEAHEADKMQRANDKRGEKMKMFKSFITMCAEMDQNNDGQLSVEEFMHACKTNVALKDMMTVLDIEEKDLHTVFSYLDEDKSDGIDYEELCTQLYRLQHQDPKTLLMLLRMSITELKHDFDDFRYTRHVKTQEQIEAMSKRVEDMGALLQERLDPLRGHTSQATTADTTAEASDGGARQFTENKALDKRCEDDRNVESGSCSSGNALDDILTTAKRRLAAQINSDMMSRMDDWTLMLSEELKTDSLGLKHAAPCTRNSTLVVEDNVQPWWPQRAAVRGDVILNNTRHDLTAGNERQNITAGTERSSDVGSSGKVPALQLRSPIQTRSRHVSGLSSPPTAVPPAPKDLQESPRPPPDVGKR